MGVVYQGSMKARKRKWFFQLIKAGGSLISDDHDVNITSNLQWGEDSTTGFLDRLIMPASLRVEFTDPGSVIFDDIRQAGVNAFTLRIYDSTLTYEMDFFLRLQSSFTPLKDEIAVPVTRLLARCGLTRLPEMDAAVGLTRTTHQIFKFILSDNLRAQDILYLFGTRNSREGVSGNWIEQLRYPDLDYAYTGLGEDPDEVDTAGNMLTDFVEAFQCMVWNDLHYGRRWVVAQPWLLGRDITVVSRLAALYDEEAGTVDAVEVPGQVALLSTEDKALRGLFDADRAVEIVIGSKRDEITNILIQKGSLSEGWSGANNIFWPGSEPNIFNETTEGGYVDIGGRSVKNHTILVKVGKWVRVTLDFDYALEYAPGGIGTHGQEYKLLAEPLDPLGTTYYSDDAAGTDVWTSTDTTLSEAAVTPDPNGTAPASLTWRNVIHTLADYMQEDGYLVFQFLGDTGSDYFSHIRNAKIILEDQAASAITDTPPWPAHGTSEAVGGSVTEGPTVEYQRPWHPVTLEKTAVEDVEVEVDHTGTGIWGLPNNWVDASEASGPYFDLNEWIIRARLARGAGGRLLKGTHKGILTPGTIIQALGERFIVIYVNVDLHTETTTYLVYEELLKLAS